MGALIIGTLERGRWVGRPVIAIVECFRVAVLELALRYGTGERRGRLRLRQSLIADLPPIWLTWKVPGLSSSFDCLSAGCYGRKCKRSQVFPKVSKRHFRSPRFLLNVKHVKGQMYNHQ